MCVWGGGGWHAAHGPLQASFRQGRGSACPLSHPGPTGGPTRFNPVSKDDPFHNLYHSIEIPGLLKYILLTSYRRGVQIPPRDSAFFFLARRPRTTARPSHLPHP